MIREAIGKLVEKKSLALTEAETVMQEIMAGQATQSQIGSFLTAMRMKGETPEEIAGCARAMRANSLKVKTKQKNLVDTCGTGGDQAGTFNISTIVAFLVAGAGLAVAKHGNRSVSSHCGSADLLEALGVNMGLGVDEVGQCIDEVGIGFLFAPSLHPAMRNVQAPRQEMGIRTIFNILGPLTNPASASIQLIGVYAPQLTETVAQVLNLLGTSRAMVVHGANGLDELSVTGDNRITYLRDGKLTTFHLDPRELGIPQVAVAELQGGTPRENAGIALELLQGERSPRRNVVLLNAAACFVAAGKAADFQKGLVMAAEAVDSGNALKKLDQLIQFSQSF